MGLRYGLIALLILTFTATAHAQRTFRLNVGDPAPNVDVEEWLLGEEMQGFEKGKVYIVEFWATWCVPCRQAIPFLNRLQQSYGDDGLEIIGISGEEVRDVRRFVQENPGLISYRVAVDRSNNSQRNWMNASGQQGIPTSFIVDRDGIIQYIGHPQGEHIETILRLVLQGRYNAKLFSEVASMVSAYETARKVRNWRLAQSHLDQIIEHHPHVFAMFNIAKFEMMLIDMNDPKAAYEFARKLVVDYVSDSYFLAWLAQHIVTEPKIPNEHRDLDLALKAAKAARDGGRPNDPELLSILALVHFHKGDIDEAIRLQRRAWMVAPPIRKAPYERALRSYQDARQHASRMQTAPDS